MKPARFFVLRSSNDDDIHKVFFYLIRLLNIIYGPLLQIIIFSLKNYLKNVKHQAQIFIFFIGI